MWLGRHHQGLVVIESASKESWLLDCSFIFTYTWLDLPYRVLYQCTSYDATAAANASTSTHASTTTTAFHDAATACIWRCSTMGCSLSESIWSNGSCNACSCRSWYVAVICLLLLIVWLQFILGGSHITYSVTGKATSLLPIHFPLPPSSILRAVIFLDTGTI